MKFVADIIQRVQDLWRIFRECLLDALTTIKIENIEQHFFLYTYFLLLFEKGNCLDKAMWHKTHE